MDDLSRSKMVDRWTTTGLDKLFWALSHATRRAIVQELDASSRPIAIADLARDLCEEERGGILGASRRDDSVDDLYVELSHRHVPSLVQVDVVEFNETKKTIDKGEQFRAAVELLTTVHVAGGR